MKSRNRFRSPLTRRSRKPLLSATFSANPSGSSSICAVTLLWSASRRWKVTTPACFGPSNGVHWLYTAVTGAATSTDSTTVLIETPFVRASLRLPDRLHEQTPGYQTDGTRGACDGPRGTSRRTRRQRRDRHDGHVWHTGYVRRITGQ